MHRYNAVKVVNHHCLFYLQGLMHFYSVVLGLDVLGNPVGFVRGLAGGAKGILYHPLEVRGGHD